MKVGRTASLGVLAAIAAGAAQGAPEKQAVTGPVAVYWISAATNSGMGSGQGGGAQQQPPPPHRRPSFGDLARMEATGDTSALTQNMPQQPRAGAVSHTLLLQLGSSRASEGGAPQAEHDPPQALQVGASLPLVSPEAPPAEPAVPGTPPGYHPQGRMLIYWGCGEHVGANQPLVIDFAQATAAGGGQFASLQRALALTPATPPSPGRNATYGEWPNRQNGAPVPADGSLQGGHTIRGNYTPDINFTLAADQDFLPPIQMVDNEKAPSGAANLAWRHVDGAQGYLITVFGGMGGGGGTVVWSSSGVQAMPFLPEYLSDGEIARLVAGHVLLAPTTTSCQVPAEVVQAVGMGSFRMTAYGGEVNLSSPARPPAPQPWHIAWQVKIRYRAATGGMLGMDLSKMMNGMGGPGGQPPQQPPPQQQPHRNPFNPFGF